MSEILDDGSVSLIFERATNDRSCKGSGCSNNGVKVCSRCLSVWYCCKECQVGDWKEHKKRCIAPTSTVSAIPIPKTVATFGPMPNDKKGVEKHMKSIMEKLERMAPDDKGDKMCDQCQSPALCFDCAVKPSEDGQGGSIANAKWICRQHHTSFATDASLGDEFECNCSPEVMVNFSQPCSETFTIPSNPRVLLISGLNLVRMPDGRLMDSSNKDIEKLKEIFQQKDIAYDAVVADNGNRVAEMMLRCNYTKILMYGISNRGYDRCEMMFQCGTFLVYLPIWIKAGGKFIMHGEGELITLIANVLLEERGNWHFCGDYYRRCKQSLNKVNPSISTEKFPRGYSMKATMLSGVEPRDQIYSPKPNTLSISSVPNFGGKLVSPKRTAVAAAPLGSGIIMFIGDVNLETRTVELILTV